MNERNHITADSYRTRLTRRFRRTLAAFTLIELLVVVAMLALITVGIAQIFKSAGDTARAGKRVSNVNTYATMIERQLRSDFASMTRSGFLVIRNATAGGNPPCFSGEQIRLAPGDRNQRVRRVDEILFFAKGDFASQRSPVVADRAPRSTEAMIYYGHGLKWNPADPNYRADLRLDGTNVEALGFNRAGTGGARGPDQYASDWVLARRAFVLAPPTETPSSVLPNNLVEPLPVWPGVTRSTTEPNNPWEDIDKTIQVGLQPAVISAYRVISDDTRNDIPVNGNIVRDENPVQRPRLSSGIVDVIASNLTEVRNVLIDSQPFNDPNYFWIPYSLEADRGVSGDPVPPNAGAVTDRGMPGAAFQIDTQPGSANSVTRRMQAWMRQAFPADSDSGRRVRLEIDPPDWSGSRDSNNAAPYDKEYKRTDQETITAFNFVPHCTEFIVEWSFGKVYPTDFPTTELRGQVIWHGMERRADLNGDGTIQAGLLSPELIAYPYADPLRGGVDLYDAPFRLTNGKVDYRTVNVNLIRVPTPPIGGCQGVEYSYFGIVDPTWRVRSGYVDLAPRNGRYDAGEAFEDANGDGIRQPTERALGNGDGFFDAGYSPMPNEATERRRAGDPDTVPWPWPKMVRITMSIVDPLEPLNEQTFQFTFELPSEGIEE